MIIMNWNILTPYEKVLIINLLPHVRINYRFIEAPRLIGPNNSVMNSLFGDSEDFTFDFGGSLTGTSRSQSQRLKGIIAWDALKEHYDDLLTTEVEYTSDQKKLIAMWSIEAISKFYIMLAVIYHFQETYTSITQKEELTIVVTKILTQCHYELNRFLIDPNSKALLSVMDSTRMFYEEPQWNCAGYDKVLDKIATYQTDWFNIYPFAPRPDKK
jgi:hypothetical protein